MRSLVIAAALAAVVTPLSFAQSCDADPAFAGHRTANGTVRAQYNAVERGEWPNVVSIGESVVAGGVSARNKIAAYSNLCAGYAATGEFESAISACNAALELNDGAWRALNNRGAAQWLAGNHAAAATEFQAANMASSGEDEVEANLALATCVTSS